MNTPQERYHAIAEAAKTLTELTSTLQLQTIQDTNIEELAGCYSSFSPRTSSKRSQQKPPRSPQTKSGTQKNNSPQNQSIRKTP